MALCCVMMFMVAFGGMPTNEVYASTNIDLFDNISVTIYANRTREYTFYVPDGNSYKVETTGSKDTYLEISGQTSTDNFDDDSGVGTNARIIFEGNNRTVTIKVGLNDKTDKGTFKLYLVPETSTEVKVKAYSDSAMRDLYTQSNIGAFILNASGPFLHNWNIVFDESYYNVPSYFKIENCTLSDSQLCTTVACGSTCVNEAVANNHHKNLYQLYCEFYDNDLKGNFDILLGMTGVVNCSINEEGEHVNAYWGLAGANTDIAVIEGSADLTNYNIIGNIQHEISHLFGCDDPSRASPCTSNQKCIMSGGFNERNTGEIMNIWCDKCKSDFAPRTY